VSSGIARLERSFEIDKKMTSVALELYESLYVEALRMMDRPLPVEKLVKLEGDERAVYLAMCDLDGEDQDVKVEDLKRETMLSENAVRDALHKLRERNLVYSPKRGLYRLVPLR